MVAVVTLTELDINAIGAALDERNKRLAGEVVRLRAQPKSQSRDFAIECAQDAIRDGIRARLLIANAVAPDEPEDMTFIEAESRLLWGDR